MSFPACFNDQVEFDQWTKFKKQLGEHCTYCDDCETKYKEKMILAGRCFPPEFKKSDKEAEGRTCRYCGKTDSDVGFYPSKLTQCIPCTLASQREFRRKRLGRPLITRESLTEKSLNDVISALALGPNDAVSVSKLVGKNKRYVRTLFNKLLDQGKIYVSSTKRVQIKKANVYSLTENRMAA